MKKIVLILIIENSLTNNGPGKNWKEHDSSNPNSEPLEEEAIACISSWRNLNHQLNNIQIYCICPTNKPPAIATIKRLLELGVNYIHTPINDLLGADCGYINVPYGCDYIVNNIEADLYLHIDLDMTLISPLSMSFFNNIEYAAIGRLNDKERKPHAMSPGPSFESNFIIGTKEFYNDWKHTVHLMRKNNNIPKEYIAELEEFAIDKLANSKNINEISDYQVGHRYNIDNMKSLKNIIFHHNHLYEPMDNFEKYIKRILKEKLQWK